MSFNIAKWFIHIQSISWLFAAKNKALFESCLHKPDLIPASRLELGICQSTGRVWRGFNIQPATWVLYIWWSNRGMMEVICWDIHWDMQWFLKMAAGEMGHPDFQKHPCQWSGWWENYGKSTGRASCCYSTKTVRNIEVYLTHWIIGGSTKNHDADSSQCQPTVVAHLRCLLNVLSYPLDSQLFLAYALCSPCAAKGKSMSQPNEGLAHPRISRHQHRGLWQSHKKVAKRYHQDLDFYWPAQSLSTTVGV